jgi:rhodanese-related sulfurtransferase
MSLAKDPPTLSNLTGIVVKKILTLAFCFAVVSVAAPSALACEGKDKSVQAKSEITKVSVDELAAKLKTNTQGKVAVTVLDVNSSKTRQKHGVIPGAVLLGAYDEFEMSALPADKNAELVFYCAAQQCGASKKAAKRALQAGYTNVGVLPAGIKGWVKANQKAIKPANT